MSDTSKEIEYCLKCGNENPVDREICECGGRNFIYGKNYIFNHKPRKITCNCGNNEFEQIFHCNSRPFFTTNYKCTSCGNVIGKQTYLESEYDGI